MADTEAYYKILGVSKTANTKEIQKATRKLLLQNHPNKGGDAEKFKDINEASSVLSDDVLRKAYDTGGKTAVAAAITAQSQAEAKAATEGTAATVTSEGTAPSTVATTAAPPPPGSISMQEAPLNGSGWGFYSSLLTYMGVTAEEFTKALKELSKEGILSIFTTPENLSTDAINKYLDLKNKRIL